MNEEKTNTSSSRLIQQERILTEIKSYIDDMREIAERGKSTYLLANNPMGFAYTQCILDFVRNIDILLSGQHIPTMKEIEERMLEYKIKESCKGVDVR